MSNQSLKGIFSQIKLTQTTLIEKPHLFCLRRQDPMMSAVQPQNIFGISWLLQDLQCNPDSGLSVWNVASKQYKAWKQLNPVYPGNKHFMTAGFTPMSLETSQQHWSSKIAGFRSSSSVLALSLAVVFYSVWGTSSSVFSDLICFQSNSDAGHLEILFSVYKWRGVP